MKTIFKPTIWKIILAVIILLALFPLMLFYAFSCVEFSLPSGWDGICFIFYPVVLLFYFIGKIGEIFLFFLPPNLKNWTIFIIIGVPFSYLVSCLIIFIYKQIKTSDFIKPSLKKLFFTILLLVIFSILSNFFNFSFHGSGFSSVGRYYLGFPVYIFKSMKQYIVGNFPKLTIENFSGINLVVDIIFWYLIVCLLLLIYSKLKKKRARI